MESMVRSVIISFWSRDIPTPFSIESTAAISVSLLVVQSVSSFGRRSKRTMRAVSEGPRRVTKSRS